MRRAIPAALLAVALPAVAITDLDLPGAWEALEKANPDHYARAAGVLRLASAAPCDEPKNARLIQVDFKVAELSCPAILKTSYPATFEISFMLDEVGYRARSKLKPGEKLVPLGK